MAPTSGFLIGWPVAAFVTGWIVAHWRGVSLTVVAAVASMVGGIVVLYLFGIVGMSLALDKTLTESALLVTAFVPGDLLKAVMAGVITGSLARARPASVLARRDEKT